MSLYSHTQLIFSCWNWNYALQHDMRCPKFHDNCQQQLISIFFYCFSIAFLVKHKHNFLFNFGLVRRIKHMSKNMKFEQQQPQFAVVRSLLFFQWRSRDLFIASTEVSLFFFNKVAYIKGHFIFSLHFFLNEADYNDEKKNQLR